MSKELMKAVKAMNKSGLAEEIDTDLEGAELEEAFMESVESVSPKDEKKLPDSVVEMYNELSTKPAPKSKKKAKDDDDDDDEDDEPKKKKGKKASKDDDDDDDDDDEDEKPAKKSKKKAKDDDDDDDEDDEPKKKKGKKSSKKDDDDDDDDDDEDEKPVKKGKGKKTLSTMQQICMRVVNSAPGASFEKMTKKALAECEEGVDLESIVVDTLNQCLDYYSILNDEDALAE